MSRDLKCTKFRKPKDNQCFINFKNTADAKKCHKELQIKNICEELIGYCCKVALANPIDKCGAPILYKDKRDKKILPSLESKYNKSINNVGLTCDKHNITQNNTN